MNTVSKNKTISFIALLLPLQWAAIKIVEHFNNTIEIVFSQGVFRLESTILKVLLGWIPFSIGQWLFYIMLFYFVKILIKSIINLSKSNYKKPINIWNYIKKPIAFLSIVYLAFNLLWGLNYYRNSLYQNLGFKEHNVKLETLVPLAEKLIDNTNKYRIASQANLDTCLTLNWKNKQYFHEAQLAYEHLAAQDSFFNNNHPSVKAVAFPQLMSLFGIGGIYFPFTAEANVNMHQPDFKLPFTVCHEMAHQIGIGSESEANFIAYLACNASDDPVFNYSGNFSAMRYVLNAIHFTDSTAFNKLIVKLNKGVLLDLEANTMYWEKFETPLDNFSRWMNNLYLKSNGQRDGVKSYGKMVELMVAFEYDKLSRESKNSYKPKKQKKVVNNEPISNLETVELPFSYAKNDLKLIKIDSHLCLENRYYLLKQIKNQQLFITYDLPSDNLLLAEINNGKIIKTETIEFNNPLKKMVISEKGIITDDLKIKIDVLMLQCNNINDSLTICDTINSETVKPFYTDSIP
ncbi:MAG: DUF3810 domain-containing protein [Bacteroidia bacterium]